MSQDQSPHHMPDERDPLAEELETALAVLQARQVPHAPHLGAAELDMAMALVDLAWTLEPDPAFITDLEARLRVQARRLASPGHQSGGGGETLSAVTRAAPRTSEDRQRLRPLGLLPPFWAAVAALLLLSLLLLLVPRVQAGVCQVLRLGAVRIGCAAPVPPRASPTPTAISSPLDLAGATTLAQAQSAAGFTIRLPTYPLDLGPPDRVFFQQLEGRMVVLVWLQPGDQSHVRLALYELNNSIWFYKVAPPVLATATVSGRPAIWTEGPYIVEVLDHGQQQMEERLLVTGHVLVWTDGTLTYRLETDLSLPEALRIAASVR